MVLAGVTAAGPFSGWIIVAASMLITASSGPGSAMLVTIVSLALGPVALAAHRGQFDGYAVGLTCMAALMIVGALLLALVAPSHPPHSARESAT